MDCYGIIYRIVNKTNGKSYIGKTKAYYGNEEFGPYRRFRQHKINAFSPSKKNDCPLFYNAIRKYGPDAFFLEVITHCELNQTNLFEIKFINLYSTTNKKFGYNITSGGDGRSSVQISEQSREKSSQTQSSKILNIGKVYRKSVLVGYKVSRRQNGKLFRKYFSSIKNTPEKNLELARNFVENIKSGSFSDTKYNKENLGLNLPIGISLYKNRSKIVSGYICTIKKYKKIFSDSKFTMEEKLAYALEWLEQMRQKNTDFRSEYDSKHSSVVEMKNITIAKNKKGIETGYVVKIIKNSQVYKKGFETSLLTMEEKYILAITWRNEQKKLLA